MSEGYRTFGDDSSGVLSGLTGPTTRWSRRIHAIAAGSFKVKESPAIPGRGYVVESLETALWACTKGRDFEEARY